MKAIAVAAVTCLALPPRALAQDACAEDVQRLCPDVKPGSSRIARCLRENEAKLSASCRARVEADASKARSIIEEFGRACRTDVDQFCPGVEPGGGRVLGCLAQHQLELSPACQAQLDRFADARERVAAFRQACRAEVASLCEGVPPQAGPLLECLQENEARLSSACSAAELRRAAEAASVVDVLEELTRRDRVREALQILQGIDSVAFSRSQVLLQFDSYQRFLDKGNATRFQFNPQFVLGREFALQIKVPVKTFYPSAAGAPAQSAVGEVTTSFAWNFASHGQVRHFLSLGLQWERLLPPPLGGPWALQPAYAVAMGLARWVSLTGQLVWFRSLGDTGAYPKVDVLLLEPILVGNLPGRSFLSLDTKLFWNLATGKFAPLMKGVAGIFTDRQKSVSISAWYQGSLTSAGVSQSFQFEVGLGLAYFFDF
ncbi:MAG TPA: cysteine rich repeat-containing protein [Anaeromyxobacteraceae bacterium]|nr:cysteine rich repeat-containing protein [Anaeromyxobacteraceae bacterium]